jgi:catechol 2,3-dioxygenase
VTDKSCDLIWTENFTASRGRPHHVVAPPTRGDVLKSADVGLENGTLLATGPHKHAIQQTFFRYVYEPGDNRIELSDRRAARDGTASRPVSWTSEERAEGQGWGLNNIESFHTHDTPRVHRDPAPTMTPRPGSLVRR